LMIANASGLIAVPDDSFVGQCGTGCCVRMALTTFTRADSPARAGDLWRCVLGGWVGWASSEGNTRVTWDSRSSHRPRQRRARSFKKNSASASLYRQIGDRRRQSASGAGGALSGAGDASGGKAVAAALGGWRRGWTVISLGHDDADELSAFELYSKSWCRRPPLTGTPAAGDAGHSNSAQLSEVAEWLETLPLERVRRRTPGGCPARRDSGGSHHG